MHLHAPPARRVLFPVQSSSDQMMGNGKMVLPPISRAAHREYLRSSTTPDEVTE
jgi:hypothetical protein